MNEKRHVISLKHPFNQRLTNRDFFMNFILEIIMSLSKAIYPVLHKLLHKYYVVF